LTAKLHIYFETDVKNVANEQIIFPSRGKFIYIGREFHLHREGILSRSRENFEPIYRPIFDDIPSRSRNPIMKRLMIGYEKILGVAS
jgi:hypothetical protein